MISVHYYADLSALPPDALALLETDTPDSLFAGAAWFTTVLAHAMPPGSTPLFLVAMRNGQTLGLLALRQHGRNVESLTTPYSCAFAPLIREALSQPDRIATYAAFARACAAWPVLRLDALDPDDPRIAELIAGAREAGLAVQQFRHFGNWHAAVAGLTWTDYLAQRSGPLRNTVRRKTAAAQRRGTELTILRDSTGLDAGIAAYEDVYARSWKQAEPFPTFNAAMMRAFAPRGHLRLGLMHQDGKVIAAQIWLLAHGTATVVKLAHAEAYKADSPGTVLTAHMLRHLLDEERIQEIDFGRGDDAYKKEWASQRRQKIGLLLINPCRPKGMALLGRQFLVNAARRLSRRFFNPRAPT